MSIDHRSMWRVVVGSVLLLLSGCPDPVRNPAACFDGICIDPSLPFCDQDGTVFGQENTCVAVSCTPGALEQCRGDQALTCNAAGNNFEVVQCERGCDPASGCRLCNPNETACTNGMVATCDASGAIVSSEVCALGCFEDQPRCRDIDPSNNLGRFLDMVADPPDIDLDGARFETLLGEVRIGTTTISVPSFLTPSLPGIPSIRVFVAKSIKLRGVTTVDAQGDDRDPVGPAIALLARGPIEIGGTVVVGHRVGSAVSGCSPAGTGNARDDGNGRIVAGGGGGGGHATNGADGGAVDSGGVGAAGGKKGLATGTPELVPLRGGCSGGYFDAPAFDTFLTGGGAIQISSGTAISVTGTLDVSGGVGNFDHFNLTNGFIVGGGGAGGGILLEAPTVLLAGARLLATGGAGRSACPSPTAFCGAAGLGATHLSAATGGATVPYTNTPNTIMNGGGGGGGLGRVRINAVSAGTATETNAALTRGDLATR